jgi:hypothetical protein
MSSTSSPHAIALRRFAAHMRSSRFVVASNAFFAAAKSSPAGSGAGIGDAIGGAAHGEAAAFDARFLDFGLVTTTDAFVFFARFAAAGGAGADGAADQSTGT